MKKICLKSEFIAFVFTLAYSLCFADQAVLRFENDTLFKHKDNNYTHGTCLEILHLDWTVKVLQNMYAPADLTKEEHIIGDRPYCGWLGMEIGQLVLIDDESPFTHYFAVDFGMIGPSSLAGETLKLIHRWLDCRDPKGWDNLLHDEFCINFQWWTKYNIEATEWLMIVPRIGALAGTILDAIELGCDVKLGYNLSKDVGNRIMFSAAPKSTSFIDNVSIYVFAGPDVRAYAYNHILEGSLFNSKDKELGVDAKPLVGEIQFGIGLDIYTFFIRYYACWRSHEFKGQTSCPDYGGLMFGWKW